ncbi:MAG: Alkaline phosphatase synthesis sensor protein PhoR [Smithella sp. PtaU1.Bin162]|nr:MAG: Alkaline phosphatase synthesis sensor protein PhoR [Smithella sp. PtaU1.Bin162]
MKRHFFYKTFGTYLVIIILSFFVLNLFVRDEIKKIMTAQIEEQLMTSARLIDLNSPKDISRQLQQITGISGARVTLIDVQGKVFADSEKEVAGLENHIDRPEIQEARVRGRGKSVRFSKTIGVDMLYIAIPINEGATIKGYVRLARPLHDVKEAGEKSYNSFFLALVIVAFISLIIAVIFSYRLAAPIKEMERFTEGLRRGTTEGSIIIKTSDETKKLADNINYLVIELKNRIRLANEENSKLVTAFASMTEGVMILDADDKIEAVNRALSSMLASRYEDIAGKTLLEAFRNVELQQAFLKFKQTGQSVFREVALGDPEPVILNVSISGIKVESGNAKTMVVFHDITRLKKLERVRIDFVANVTHEIRTPLTAILGYLETIRDGAINNPEEARKFIDIILKHAQRLNRLVEDLLTISRIELGEVNFHFEDVSPADVINNVLPVIDPKAKSKRIEIDNLIPEKLPLIRADKDRLTQIFVNILDNAVKFTPESGKVSISAEETNGFVLVGISDTGIGVPKEEIERLGERFYRVDKTRSRDLGGTGLGLSIVKHLMIAHGGKMEIESQLGRGTKVFLFFPVMK